MSEYGFELFPKVYTAGRQQKVYVRLCGCPESEKTAPVLKIQGMERYTEKHLPQYRIDEEERYPLLPMTREGDGCFSFEYDFPHEQRYSVTVKLGDTVLCKTHVYAVMPDLAELQSYKMDTHLHSCRSDGKGTPAEVGCAYRRAGYDVIAVTDHHKYAPSLEAKEYFEKYTDMFTVLRGEEVHNKGMGYFHIINLDGDHSVNEIIESDDERVKTEVARILAERNLDGCADPYACAYRIFVANEIRRGGGVAIMAHPFWECYGEYNAECRDVEYLLRNRCFDALEVLAGCDRTNHGNNLQVALWSDLRADGVKIPVVGASDAHSTEEKIGELFNKQFSLVFADGVSEIKDAIKDERSVAVLRRDDGDFFVFGRFRYAKYARFLMEEYYPAYARLAAVHGELLAAAGERDVTAELAAAEARINEYKRAFFGA